MKKKLLGILFVLGLLLALPSVVSFAAKAQGSCGADSNEGGADSVKWVLDNNGTLTISGTGNMKDYDSFNNVVAPWDDVREDIKTVVIENGVTNVGAYAFGNCTNLTSVAIPNCVKIIGEYAFDICRNLTSVTIPNGVTTICGSAFIGCHSIESITIPSSVTRMGNDVFNDCKRLTSVTIPDSVTSIGDGVFFGCTSLTSVTIPDSVTSIGNYTFQLCTSLTSVTMSNSLTSIGNYIFDGCKRLTSVTIPNGVTSIGNYTFRLCTSLTSVTIPDSVTSIGDGAFDYCTSLTSVTIPDSVTDIKFAAFRSCTSLKSVTIPNSVTSIGNDIFGDCTSLKSVTISNSVTSIGKYTFSGCTGLTTVTIPNSVTSIGEGAFSSCTGLTTIYIPMHYDTESETYKELDLSSANIPETATKLYYIAGAAGGNITPVTIDSVTYGTDKGNSITLPCDIMGNGYVIQSAGENTGVTINHKSSEVYTLEGSEIYTPVTGGNLAAKCICSGVVTIPGPVDPYANLVISETVAVNEEELPVTAISGGYTESGYTTVTVPKDVKYISKGAFYTNENLDTIYLPEGCQMESESVPLTTKIVYYKVNKDERGNAVVRTASTGEEITQVTVSRVDVLKPDQELNLNNIYGKYEITAIDDDALDNSGKNLHTVILPNSVESINAKVFENCKNLETIYLKEGCVINTSTTNEGNEEKIADKNLIYYTDDGATISNAKINIDNFPLELSKINNRCNITTIGENAFKDQVKMISVTIPATVKEIKANPFAGCTGLKDITVDNGNTAYKFENGVLLSKDGETLVCYPAGNAGTTYTTPEGVTAIAAQAFADCKNLENVVLRETVTSVGADAFTGCNKLMAVYAQKDCDIDSTVLNNENIIYYIVTNENDGRKEVTIGKKIDIIEGEDIDALEGKGCRINKYGTELDLSVLNNTGLYKITCIGAGAFYQDKNDSMQNRLKSIIIPEGVTDVKTCFLRCSRALEFVKLPTTLTSSLPQYSITDTKFLKTLTIPHKVGSIHVEAFTSTESLETVYVAEKLIEDINNTITERGNLAGANIIYFNITKERGPIEICIGGYSTSVTDNDLTGSCIINREGSTVDLRTIDENYKITAIGVSAFSGCGSEKNKNNLKEIIIPEGVTNIAKEAFRSCEQLTSITLPATYAGELPHYFITDNNQLKTLVLPHGVTGINSEAFIEVTGLTRVFLKDGLDRGTVFKKSESAKFIRYGVTNEDVSPKEVKIVNASDSVEVYCDEMGDRYVITGNNSSSVTLKHRGDVEVPAKEATCEENGTKAYWKCLCGGRNCTEKDSETKVENLTIAATGHTSLSEVPAKAATFHACGVKAHYVCEKCKKLFEDKDAANSTTLNKLVIPEHKDHDFGAYSHDYENQALHADVCALKGTVAATCAICDQTDVKSCAEHTKSSHVWTKGEKIPATCKTTGTQAYTCSLCNESETKTLEIDPNNHDYSIEVEGTEKEATCTAKGKEADKKCSRCEAVQTGKEIEIDPNNHDYSIEVEGTAKEATCTAKGKEADKKCSRCEAVQTGKEIEIDPNNHTNVEGTEAKAATCTEAGNDEYWYCRGCDKYFADKECTTVITDISKVTRPATGHDYGTSTYEWNCDNLENVTCTATKKCSNCKEEATKTVNAVVEETIEATCTTPKKVTYKAEFEEEFGGTQTKTVEIGSALGHDYGTSTYEWNCDNLENVTCTATKKCSNCKEEATKTVNAVVEETIEATCTTPKKVTYKAEFEEEFGGTQTKTVEIGSAKGHTYGKVEYTWSNDYGNCTAKRVCQNDTSHVETENATKITENIIKAATCEGVGKKTYKAEFNSFTSCETEELDIPATGHKCNDTWEHNETQHWKVCETCEKEVNAANHTDENSDGTCDVCGYVTTPDTYTVSGTVYTWDNTDSNTTRVRLYDSTASEDDIKSDIQHDITGESDTKIYQYDANEIGTPEESTSNRYTQSFEFTGVANGEYKLAAWRPAYDISNKHYAYAVRITDVTVNGTDVTVDENATKLWLYGDVSGDGKIDAGDATNILAYVIGKSSSIDEDNKAIGDVNDDGNVDAGDATNVLAYIIGKSSILDDKK